MRIRTKRHEIMISPGQSSSVAHLILLMRPLDERYLLAVLHDPTVT
jgi:hypothetical protein